MSDETFVPILARWPGYRALRTTVEWRPRPAADDAVDARPPMPPPPIATTPTPVPTLREKLQARRRAEGSGG